MRTIQTTEYIDVKAKTTVDIDRRAVTVTGPRGTLHRKFKHVQMELRKLESGKIRVDFWWTNRKQAASMRTVCTHIENMMIGVTQGYMYKMRSVYAHFPINIAIVNGGKTVEIRNFLGEKIVRVVKMHPGVEIKAGDKDEVVLTGNDIEMVSVSAARVQQSTTVKHKDIRKFLDGIYVSEKSNITVIE